MEERWWPEGTMQGGLEGVDGTDLEVAVGRRNEVWGGEGQGMCQRGLGHRKGLRARREWGVKATSVPRKEGLAAGNSVTEQC